MSLLNNSNAIPTKGGDYKLENSLRFRSSANAYLSRTPATAGNRQTLTYSCWFKLGSTELHLLETGNVSSTLAGIVSLTDGTIRIQDFVSSAQQYKLITAQVFRDPSSWYHLVFVLDTTNAISTDRLRLYINGSRVTSFSTEVYPALSYSGTLNTAEVTSIGSRSYNLSAYGDQYLTEVNFVDGQALTPSDFGDTNEDTGVWQPKNYTGTYGTNGFYLKGRGTDNSGNGNNWTETNFNTTNSALTTYDIMTDVPTLTDEDTANYATLNPNIGVTGTTNVTLSEANLKFENADLSFRRYIPSTISIAPSSGKYYCEGEYTVSSQANYDCFGIADAQLLGDGKSGGSNVVGIWAYRRNGNADIENTGGTLGIAYGATWAIGDIIGIAYDSDAGALTFYKNGVSQGQLVTGIDITVCFFVSGFSSCDAYMNFGQRPFAYTPPTGYKKLNTFNLPDSSIVDGSEYFNTVLYNGAVGNSPQSITGVGFEPDFVWLKERSSTSANFLNQANDGTVRFMQSNTTNAEVTDAQVVGSFDSDGFSVGNSGGSNQSGQTYVTWNWKAGGTAVSNTDGTITSSVSANPTAGFSVVTWTGTGATATVGHGLGVVPKLYITKDRTNSSTNWHYHTTQIDGGMDFLFLNTTSTSTSSSLSTPSSTVITAGGTINTSSANFVSYVFADVEGYSKFGSYTGNGSTNGPFIYTGFRPAWILVKCTTTAGQNWWVLDDKRNMYNLANLALLPNNSSSELSNSTYFYADFLSNGFKLRSTGQSNTNAATYIYMAFAENPFKNSLAR